MKMRCSLGLRTTLSLALLLGSATSWAQGLSGQVIDQDGKPIAGALVTVESSRSGPAAISVFSGGDGRFAFPASIQAGNGALAGRTFKVRALNHEVNQVRILPGADGKLSLTLTGRATTNQSHAAPASAWLRSPLAAAAPAAGAIRPRGGRAAANPHAANSEFIMDCVGCHQVPTLEFRNYAKAMAAIPGTDRKDVAQRGYKALVNYMNYISAEEFGRVPAETFAQDPFAQVPEHNNVYSVGNDGRVVDYLTSRFSNDMSSVSGYDWGAPLAITPRTTITEYEIDAPNAIREAVMLGDVDPQLYVADVSSNRMIKVDMATGKQRVLEIPHSGPVGPHSLHRAPDGNLWIAPFVSSVVALLDIKTEKWRTWPMRTNDGKRTGIHDLSFGVDHTVKTDAKGNIWYSDIGNDAVGYMHPETGDTVIYPSPDLPKDRPANGSLYGLAMSEDAKTIWYTQIAGDHFGSFNVDTRKYEASVLLPKNSGPRRIAMGDGGRLYVPLYGGGQLVEYDTLARRIIATHDLPDRASAPYAVTWDPVRKVVWIPTSNADVIYKFNPADRSFGVIPMPRQSAYLRMIDVDPSTGWLITSYANIVEQVHGPRMAVVIDVGDDAYVGARRGASAASIATGEMLVKQRRCYACHNATQNLIGPSYQTIAARYAAEREPAARDAVVSSLAEKIIKGGGGNWGVVPMVPNEHVTAAEAERMARWILAR